jgi:hypothetical protein
MVTPGGRLCDALARLAPTEPSGCFHTHQPSTVSSQWAAACRPRPRAPRLRWDPRRPQQQRVACARPNPFSTRARPRRTRRRACAACVRARPPACLTRRAAAAGHLAHRARRGTEPRAEQSQLRWRRECNPRRCAAHGRAHLRPRMSPPSSGSPWRTPTRPRRRRSRRSHLCRSCCQGWDGNAALDGPRLTWVCSIPSSNVVDRFLGDRSVAPSAKTDWRREQYSSLRATLSETLGNSHVLR